MGCPHSRLPPTPNNPLQLQQYLEAKREQRKRKLEKEQKKIAKLQKKHLKKKHKKNSEIRRTSNAKRQSNTPRISNFNYQTMRFDINKDEYDRNLENKLKNQLDNDLCLFITNQISLTVQFFGHFESEISAVGNEVLAKEQEINQNLEQHSILLSNPLDTAIEKWLQYQPMHGPEKCNPKPLQTKTMYVVFENIDIARPNDANYDSISPIWKVDLETDYYRTTPTKEDYVELLRENKWKGYVRLRLRENAKTAAIYGEQEIYTDGSSGYSTTSHSYVNQLTSHGYSNIEKENDYAYVTSLHSHQPLSTLCIRNQREKLLLNERVLPESCISSLGQFVEPWNEDDTDDERDEEETDSEDEGHDSDGPALSDSKISIHHAHYHTLQALKQHKLEQERRRQLLQQRYLNSKEFMCYFGELVRQKLAKPLQLPSKELLNGTFVGASIHTKHYHIIPAIHVACNAQNWPDCAFQFKRRERPISTNPNTGEQSQWPSRAMIQRIEGFGFHVIPMGFAPKRLRNPYRQLEWRIVFPKAERYLERNLSSTQIKVFMICKALVKSFVEPQEKENHALMFTIDYLRTHLFWECERNYTIWSEEFLGEVLLRFLQSFIVRLREKKLRDFFIEERNLFDNVPDFSLLRLNQILAEIVANPLMHLLVAFRNMRYAEDFFPKLNFRKLFDNLVENDLMKLRSLTKNTNQQMVAMMIANVEEEPLYMQDECSQGLVVGMKEHREKTKGKLRRRTQVMRHNIEVKKQQELHKKRLSVESINVEFFFTKNLCSSIAKNINQGVENLRRTNILEIILDHLIATADKATQLRSVDLAKVQLDQARRLCKFYHNYGCDMAAQEYLQSIDSIENQIEVLRRTDSNIPPPALPVRTSVEPINSIKSKVKEIKNDQEATTNENIYVIQRTKPKIEENQESKPAIKESPVESKKFIKFTEHVVEVHDGDTNRTKKAIGYSPVSILRSAELKDMKRPGKSIEVLSNSSEEEAPDNAQTKIDARKYSEIRTKVTFDENDNVSKKKSEGYSPLLMLRSPQLSQIKNSVTLSDAKQEELTNEAKFETSCKGSPIQDVNSEESSDEENLNAFSGQRRRLIERQAYAESEHNTGDNANIEDEVSEINEDVVNKNPADPNEGQTDNTSSTSAYLKLKLGAAANVIKNSSIAKSKPITHLTTSTEKLLNSKTLEEKRTQVLELMKRKTISLKGAFNQSTDT